MHRVVLLAELWFGMCENWQGVVRARSDASVILITGSGLPGAYFCCKLFIFMLSNFCRNATLRCFYTRWDKYIKQII